MQSPSIDERARLKSEFAHRFPEIATIRLVGDGGAPVSLPVVLGNPSATSTSEPKPSPAWANILRASLGLGREPGDAASALASDCLLWPGPREWAAHVARWPGLPATISGEVQAKIAMRTDAVTPAWGADDVPADVAAALAASPAAVWFHARPRDGVHYAIVLQPPEGGVWRSSKAALTKPDADHWSFVRGLVKRCALRSLVEVEGEWSPLPIDDVIARFPGLAVILFGRLAEMVGTSAKAELGEL